MEDWKEVIKSWRWRIMRSGKTARSFSRLVGVSQSSLSMYFSGKRTPKIQTYMRIEKSICDLEEKID